tara:strand:+ start:54879 stop:55268 length:390 start_codon:yes stop_codon:yes gene_type:complete
LVKKGGEKMLEEKKIVSNKANLFAKQETEVHYIRVEPDSDEYLKVWVKEPTFLEVEKAQMKLVKVNPRTQEVDINMAEATRYLFETFIEKTEPNLSAVDLLRLTPYVGNQIKEILPNVMGGNEEKEKKE